ncbi:hypothetical protein [Nocardia sp. NPDC002869]|uniref:hypothetical protein n=1 Tax=Nocardia sp. NPDC002869 TaxID=3161032 RepID=UPI00398D38A6
MTSVDPTTRNEYDDRITRWADRLDSLTSDQAEGWECITGCGYNQLRDRDPDRPMYPAGFGPHGGQVFVCSRCDDADRNQTADPMGSATSRALTAVDMPKASSGEDAGMNDEQPGFEVEGGTPCEGVEIVSPWMLYANTYVMHGSKFLLEARSPLVKLDSVLYAPVAAYLAEHPDAVLVWEETRPEEHMAWGEVVSRLWLIGDAD